MKKKININGDSPDIISKEWYKPNCNFIGSPQECIFTETQTSQGVLECLYKRGTSNSGGCKMQALETKA